MRKMMKILSLLFISLLFFSCSDDDGYSLDKFWVSVATIDTEDVEPYIIVTDNGDKLFPSASHVVNFIPKNGQRVWVSYTILGEERGRFDYYVRVNDIREILTKGIITLTDAIKDSIGHDPVEIESAWFTGDYLTIGFVYGGGGAIHFINLVSDESAPTNDEGVPVLEFRHNRNQDRYNAAMRGWVSFDLSKLKQPDKDSVTFILKAKSFEGHEPFEKQMVFKYDDIKE